MTFGSCQLLFKQHNIGKGRGYDILWATFRNGAKVVIIGSCGE